MADPMAAIRAALDVAQKYNAPEAGDEDQADDHDDDHKHKKDKKHKKEHKHKHRSSMMSGDHDQGHEGHHRMSAIQEGHHMSQAPVMDHRQSIQSPTTMDHRTSYQSQGHAQSPTTNHRMSQSPNSPMVEYDNQGQGVHRQSLKEGVYKTPRRSVR